MACPCLAPSGAGRHLRLGYTGYDITNKTRCLQLTYCCVRYAPPNDKNQHQYHTRKRIGGYLAGPDSQLQASARDQRGQIVSQRTSEAKDLLSLAFTDLPLLLVRVLDHTSSRIRLVGCMYAELSSSQACGRFSYKWNCRVPIQPIFMRLHMFYRTDQIGWGVSTPVSG